LKEISCGDIRGGSIIPEEEIVDCPYGCENGACVCQDSDGGINYDERGVVGTYEDYCLDDRDIIEYYTEVRSNKCYIESVAHTCEGLCSEGRCLPPTCEDGIRNQGEEEVDCGGPCTPCGYVAIKGRILYQEADVSGNPKSDTAGNPIFKPARFLKFKIEGEVSTGTKLTDSNGFFYVLINRDGNVGKEVHIKIGDCDMYNGGFNYAVKIARDLDRCNEYMIWDSYSLTIPETGDVDFGELKIWIDKDVDFDAKWRDGPWTAERACGRSACTRDIHHDVGGAAYFNIAETILVAREYADGKRDGSDSIGKVTVEWPDAEWPNYTPFWELIKLRRDFGFNDGTIVHEYGHHLEKKISAHDRVFIGDISHTFCSDKDDTEFAWSEGFAEYFGTIVPHHHKYPDPQFLSGPNIDYKRIESLNCNYTCLEIAIRRGARFFPLATSDFSEFFRLHPELFSGTLCNENSTWNDNSGIFKSRKTIEGTVANVLWDLVDEPGPDFPRSVAESFDTISGKEDLIFSIFDRELDNRADAPDLCEFVREGWDCREEVRAERDAIDSILQHYNVNCQRGCGK